MDVFVFPIKFPRMIPKKWIEEAFPEVDVVNAFHALENSINSDKNCLLGVYNAKSKCLEGFLWGESHPILPKLIVFTIYICNKHRRNPKLKGKLIEYFKDNGKNLGFDSVVFLTDNPNFFLKRSCVTDKVCVRLDLNNEVL